mmetsp:Transcript_184/g.285  ORF Transcript_184/g.285 Transcript_184/m.285 type:complete len:216 (-) Transcript_184:707-1354(-)
MINFIINIFQTIGRHFQSTRTTSWSRHSSFDRWWHVSTTNMHGSSPIFHKRQWLITNIPSSVQLIPHNTYSIHRPSSQCCIIIQYSPTSCIVHKDIGLCVMLHFSFSTGRVFFVSLRCCIEFISCEDEWLSRFFFLVIVVMYINIGIVIKDEACTYSGSMRQCLKRSRSIQRYLLLSLRRRRRIIHKRKALFLHKTITTSNSSPLTQHSPLSHTS